MFRIRSRDTKLEMAMRRVLHAAGLRYWLHRKSCPAGLAWCSLPGSRIALFVHEYFLHQNGCRRSHASTSGLE